MRQALELALEALSKVGYVPDAVNPHPIFVAITAIKEALAQPEQEPVASIFISGIGEREFDDWGHDLPVGRNLLYTTPPQRKPLTDEQIQKCYETTGHYQTLRPQDKFAVFALARAIEAAHGIKE